MPTRRQTLIALAGSAVAAASPVFGQSSGWPSRTVRLLVGFPAGSTPDMTARALGDGLAKVLGQPVVVENRPGASGNIATDQVAKATDDHTLGVVINGNLTSSKQLYSNLPYDPARDFSFLSLLTVAPLVLVAGPNAPTGKAFFDAARKDGARWNYGSVGVGSVGHLGAEWMKQQAGDFSAVHVPFKGNPDIVAALANGDIQFALVPPGIALPQARAGRVTLIGLTGGRSPLAPDVPTLADAGLRDFNFEVWNALIGPARLSRTAQDRLAREVPTLLRDPAIRQRLFNAGWQPIGTSPDGLKRRVEAEARILGNVIQSRGIRLQ